MVGGNWTHLLPQLGMPTAWMMKMATWQKKTKKKKKKLKELSDLQQEIRRFSLKVPAWRSCDGAGAALSLEGLVDGPVPAEEGAGAEKDEPEDGQAKAYALIAVFDEEGQTGQKVEEQRHAVHCKPQQKVVSTGRSNPTPATFSLHLQPTAPEGLTHPQVVHHLADLLVLGRDLL